MFKKFCGQESNDFQKILLEFRQNVETSVQNPTKKKKIEREEILQR
jgi:hypothetical protein